MILSLMISPTTTKSRKRGGKEKKKKRRGKEGLSVCAGGYASRLLLDILPEGPLTPEGRRKKERGGGRREEEEEETYRCAHVRCLVVPGISLLTVRRAIRTRRAGKKGGRGRRKKGGRGAREEPGAYLVEFVGWACSFFSIIFSSSRRPPAQKEGKEKKEDVSLRRPI